jgi:hypothetical protein
MVCNRILLSAALAGLAVSLAGCQPVGYGGVGYVAPVYAGGYYGGYAAPVYAGGYYGGYGWRHGYYGGTYRRGVYYRGYGHGGYYRHGGYWRR